jgi:hypothetical protein
VVVLQKVPHHFLLLLHLLPQTLHFSLDATQGLPEFQLGVPALFDEPIVGLNFFQSGA